jgi:hypothetical protein
MSVQDVIDSDSPIPEGSPNRAALLLYDWFKHMTTLSLITLGGLLSILQAGEASVRPGLLEAIIVLIALAGIIGFDGQSRILKAELANGPLPDMLKWFRRVAVWSYSLGVGMFLSLFVESVR